MVLREFSCKLRTGLEDSRHRRHAVIRTERQPSPKHYLSPREPSHAQPEDQLTACSRRETRHPAQHFPVWTLGRASTRGLQAASPGPARRPRRAPSGRHVPALGRARRPRPPAGRRGAALAAVCGTRALRRSPPPGRILTTWERVKRGARETRRRPERSQR